jgi:hypothetical protein
MPQSSPSVARSKRRTRLLTAIRNAAVSLAISAENQGGLLVIDSGVFKRLIQAINRLMDFEDEETK